MRRELRSADFASFSAYALECSRDLAMESDLSERRNALIENLTVQRVAKNILRVGARVVLLRVTSKPPLPACKLSTQLICRSHVGFHHVRNCCRPELDATDACGLQERTFARREP